MKAFIKKIASGQAGHWGVIDLVHGPSSLGTLIEGIESAGRSGTRVERISILPLNKGLIDENGDEIDITTHAIRHFTRCHEKASNDCCECLCCVVDGFDALDSASQCRFLNHTRQIREKNGDLQVQTVIHGKWNRFRLLSEWNSNPNSPVPDMRNLWDVTGLTVDGLAEILTDRGFPQQKTLQRLAVDALLEFTGGDLVLIDEVIENLQSSRLPLDSFQEIAADVLASGRVSDNLVARLQGLPPKGIDLLADVLDSQILNASRRDPLVEDLRLLGLVKQELRAGQLFLSIPSPLLDAALRRHWKRLAPGGRQVSNSEDLEWPL